MPTIQKPAQRGNEPYPKDENEMKKARLNFVKMLNSPEVQKPMVQALQGDFQTGFQNLGRLIATIIVKVMAKIRSQYGSQVHKKFIMVLIKLAIEKVDRISKGTGVGAMPPQAAKQLEGLVMKQIIEIRKAGQQQPGQMQGAEQPQMPPQPQQQQQMQPQMQQQRPFQDGGPPTQEGLLGGM